MVMTEDEWRRVDRQIRDLCELAARTESVEEARTTAYAIWKIIQKYNLSIIEPGLMAKEIAAEFAAPAAGVPGTGRRRGRR